MNKKINEIIKEKEMSVVIEFIKVWGHPTRNEIYGPPQRAMVSEWIAKNLVHNGFAKRIQPNHE